MWVTLRGLGWSEPGPGAVCLCRGHQTNAPALLPPPPPARVPSLTPPGGQDAQGPSRMVQNMGQPTEWYLAGTVGCLPPNTDLGAS